jgi:hypothetical protein
MGRAGSSFGRRGAAIVVAIRQGKEVVGTMSVAAPLIGLSDERVVDSAADVTGKLNKDRAAMPPNNCLT